MMAHYFVIPAQAGSPLLGGIGIRAFAGVTVEEKPS
jgi:hypothetical protein